MMLARTNPPEAKLKLTDLKTGQYVMHAQFGLCVVAGFKKIDVGGTNPIFIDIRSLANPKKGIMMPLEKDHKVLPRLPTTAAEFKNAFSVLGGKRRHKKKQFFASGVARSVSNDAEIAQASIKERFEILNDLLGGLKGQGFKSINDIPTVVDGPLNYSDRMLAHKVIDLIVDELAFVMGWEPEDAREKLFEAIFTPNYLEEKLNFNANYYPDRLVDNKKFFEMFGHSIKEAEEKAGITSFSVDTELRVIGDRLRAVTMDNAPTGLGKNFHAIQIHSGVNGARRPVEVKAGQASVALKVLPSVAAPPKAAPALRKPGDKRNPAISDELKALFAQETGRIAPVGIKRNFFMGALRALTLEEFKILVQTEMRTREKLTLEKFAEQNNLSFDDAVALRNKAAAKLRAYLNPQGFAAKFAEVQPFRIKAARERREPVERVKKPVRVVRIKAAPKVPDVLPELKALFNQEIDRIPKKGPIRKFFFMAAQVLSKDEFEIFTQTEFRRRDKMGLAAYGVQNGMSFENAVILRNTASKKLRDYIRPSDKVLKYAIFRPIQGQAVVPANRFKPAKKIGANKAISDAVPPGKKDPVQYSGALNIKDIFKFESSLVPDRGQLRMFFRKAASSELSVSEFQVLTQMKLRRSDCRSSLEDIVGSMKLSIDEVVLLCNGALKKLEESLSNHDRQSLPGFFKPIRVPV